MSDESEMAGKGERLSLHVIARVRSCFNEKFGTPRQPGLAPSARAELVLQPGFDRFEALQGVDAYSHLWVLFWFHRSAGQGWRPTVRPPRLGGNQRAGVYATRSPFRPNPVGLSVVENLGIRRRGGACSILIGNHDLVDGTPVLDIKPYLPYADSPVDATAPDAYAQRPQMRLRVEFEPDARRVLARLPTADATALEALIRETLALDPRPAYQAGGSGRRYGARLADYEVRWVCDDTVARVLTVCAVDGHE